MVQEFLSRKKETFNFVGVYFLAFKDFLGKCIIFRGGGGGVWLGLKGKYECKFYLFINTRKRERED